MGSPGSDLSVLANGQMKIATESDASSVTIKSRGAHLFRQDRVISTGPESWVVSNGTGYQTRANQREALSTHATRYFRPDHLPAFSCSPDLNTFVVRDTGSEQVLGHPAFHIKIVAKPTSARTQQIEALLSEYHVYIDQQTYLVLKTSTLIFSPTVLQNHSPWETYYSDYRNVGGLLVPFHVENFLSGQKIRDITFSDVQVGVSLNAAEFE